MSYAEDNKFNNQREGDGSGVMMVMFGLGIAGLITGLVVSYYFQPSAIRTPSVYEYLTIVIPNCISNSDVPQDQKTLITAGIITAVCGVMGFMAGMMISDKSRSH